jgi:hypothetical protein
MEQGEQAGRSNKKATVRARGSMRGEAWGKKEGTVLRSPMKATVHMKGSTRGEAWGKQAGATRK